MPDKTEPQSETRRSTPGVDQDRRNFLKKSTYTAPALISLGLLTQGGALAQGKDARTEDFGTPPSLEPGSNDEPIPPPD